MKNKYKTITNETICSTTVLEKTLPYLDTAKDLLSAAQFCKT